jgi:hypothetical protein
VEVYFIHENRLFRIRMLDVENAANAGLYDRMLATFRIGTR